MNRVGGPEIRAHTLKVLESGPATTEEIRRKIFKLTDGYPLKNQRLNVIISKLRKEGAVESEMMPRGPYVHRIAEK